MFSLFSKKKTLDYSVIQGVARELDCRMDTLASLIGLKLEVESTGLSYNDAFVLLIKQGMEKRGIDLSLLDQKAEDLIFSYREELGERFMDKLLDNNLL